jgi:polyisoprenoid-binding protein YceI
VIIDLTTLRSGNALYDAELAQRLTVRRFPEAVVELDRAIMSADRYQLSGEVTLHGQTRRLTGSVSAKPADGGWLITGEHVFDVRDFEISVPSLLMVRIYPDVRVNMSLALRPGAWPPAQAETEG